MPQPISITVKGGALPVDQVERFLSLAGGLVSALLTNAGIDHAENVLLGLVQDLNGNYAVILPDAAPAALQEQINSKVEDLYLLALEGKLPHATFSGS